MARRRKRVTSDRVADEPHLQPAARLRPDPSEGRAAATLARHRKTPTDEMEHGVWDEPALSPTLAGPRPADALDYARWLATRRRATSPARSWAVTVAAALCAGPWAVLGVMLGNAANSALQPLMVIAIGPLAEEVMKVAVPLYIVERRPYLFRSPLQIPLCAVASGLVFASIENLLYLEVYVPQPSTALVFWRWTVCVGLHAGCALLNSLGLSRIWHDVHQRQAPPRLTLGWRFALAATIAHGSYNGVMTLLALAGFTF